MATPELSRGNSSRDVCTHERFDGRHHAALRHHADASRPRRRRRWRWRTARPLPLRVLARWPSAFQQRAARPLAFGPGRRWARRRSRTPAASVGVRPSLAPAPARSRFHFPLQSVVFVSCALRSLSAPRMVSENFFQAVIMTARSSDGHSSPSGL